ncbi:hydrolase, NUDIX family protein [Pseudooceanicola batsensis HTCC2597]|uniref:Hydrolase, NUDIX family protein n=1 Tax=Pseudooceanicola batsensis (strain ATCC BAA-863 / DSM 15984 / KCTC 12145 / HTCC2597) TaxID=252305 RepID=A3U1Y6_PSEBH|nr:NUDIX hydrolase [Pseudooceanicola batsensis]EAQ01920.1 hydrolase, NUDIX family protein [Pseudooceanicola batsensis HTCC2597]
MTSPNTAVPAVDKSQIRNAATVIALRDRKTEPKVLMGQRGSKAVFMPNKVVFPGGAVDPGDAQVPLAGPIPEPCAGRLLEEAEGDLVTALAAAAVRELWEETGLVLGRPGTWENPPPDWTTFAATGHVPDASALRFVFRAITPPGRPRRFDARFFVVDADEAVVSDLDDFSAACDELSALQWIPLEKARSFDLPFITEVVLAEVQQRADDPRPPASVPYFANNNENRAFRRLRGLVDLAGRED